MSHIIISISGLSQPESGLPGVVGYTRVSDMSPADQDVSWSVELAWGINQAEANTVVMEAAIMALESAGWPMSGECRCILLGSIGGM